MVPQECSKKKLRLSRSRKMKVTFNTAHTEKKVTFRSCLLPRRGRPDPAPACPSTNALLYGTTIPKPHRLRDSNDSSTFNALTSSSQSSSSLRIVLARLSTLRSSALNRSRSGVSHPVHQLHARLPDTSLHSSLCQPVE